MSFFSQIFNKTEAGEGLKSNDKYHQIIANIEKFIDTGSDIYKDFVEDIIDQDMGARITGRLSSEDKDRGNLLFKESVHLYEQEKYDLAEEKLREIINITSIAD